MSNIVNLRLTDEQAAVLLELCKIQNLQRSNVIRLALENLAMESNLEWPQNLPSHGGFERARAKRWAEKPENKT